MKKSILTACAAIASAVAIASTVESSNTFGVLKVQLKTAASDTEKEYFIGVPWEKVGATGNDTAISPIDLVLTTGLKKNDRLYYYNAGTEFKAWELTADGGAWTKLATQTFNDSKETTYSTPSGEETVARGTGLVVKTAAQYVYLSGQYNSNDPTTAQSITAATTEGTETYTLIGNYLPYAVTVTVASPKSDDKLYVNDKMYTYTNGNWTLPTKPTTGWIPGTEIVIPEIGAGCGAWYCTTSTASPGTVTLTQKSN